MLRPMKPEHIKRDAEKPTISLVAYAPAYTRNGWPVFPLHNKKPYEFLEQDERATDTRTRQRVRMKYKHSGHITQLQVLGLPQGKHQTSLC